MAPLVAQTVICLQCRRLEFSPSGMFPQGQEHSLEKEMATHYSMTPLMAESKEELKQLLLKVKEERKKVGLKLNIQKTKIMASGPITSWQTDGETMESVTDFILGGLQNHCRW